MAYSSVILGDGPKAYYRLGELSGTTANDSSSGGNVGTLHGTITLNQAGALRGDPNASMLFDGASGYITLASGLKTDAYAAFSVECWIWLSNLTYGTYARIFTNDDNTPTGHNGFQLILAPSGDGAAGYFYVGNGTTAPAVSLGTGLFAATTWIHVVGTWDGTTVRAYVNGTASVSTGSLSGTMGTAASVLTIGRAAAAAASYFPGRLDEMAIYNKALTVAQIKNHYNAALANGGTFATPRRRFGRVL